MKAKLNTFLAIVLVTVIPTFLIWIPFFFRVESFWEIPFPRQGMATVVANYDGPLYIVVAKSFYSGDVIKQFPFSLPVEYYAAHFPLFPLLIKIFAGIFGFPYSMLFVTLMSSILAVYFFHKLLSDYVSKEEALWLTFIFSIFPARWLIVRSVGAAEPLFLAGIIASVYYFKNKKYWLAGIWGALAQATKSPGILVFIAYFFAILIPYFKNTATFQITKVSEPLFKLRNILPVLLIPISLFVVFAIFNFRLGDFYAYFHSGDNIHLFFPPFSIFNYSSPWVGTFWLEEVIFVYLFALTGLFRLIQMKEAEISWLVGIFLTSIFFVSHRDIIRYALPIVPFLFVAFKDTLVRKEFRFIILLLLVPIYLFSISYISQNVMPISDWTPLL